MSTSNYIWDTLDANLKLGHIVPRDTPKFSWSFGTFWDTLNANLKLGHIVPRDTPKFSWSFGTFWDTLNANLKLGHIVPRDTPEFSWSFGTFWDTLIANLELGHFVPRDTPKFSWSFGTFWDNMAHFWDILLAGHIVPKGTLAGTFTFLGHLIGKCPASVPFLCRQTRNPEKVIKWNHVTCPHGILRLQISSTIPRKMGHLGHFGTLCPNLVSQF